MSDATLKSPASVLLDGVDLAVQMLSEGHKRNAVGDAFIEADDRDGQAQNRYVLRYLERLSAEPELIAGFAAVLSDYIMVTSHSTLDPDIYRRLTAEQIVGPVCQDQQEPSAEAAERFETGRASHLRVAWSAPAGTHGSI